MFRSARRRNHLGRLNGEKYPHFIVGNGLCAIPKSLLTSIYPSFIPDTTSDKRNGTQAVPGDEGDAIQRAAQVSNLAGGWQLPLLEWVD